MAGNLGLVPDVLKRRETIAGEVGRAARSDHPCSNEGGRPTSAVHDARTCKVVEADSSVLSTPTPGFFQWINISFF